MKKILCLDFDGVLHSYASGWKGPRNIPDPPTNGALEFLLSAIDEFDVAIHSSRSRYFGGRWFMRRWLRNHLVEWWWKSGQQGSTWRTEARTWFTAVDMQEDAERWARDIVGRISFPTKKPPAHVTIDDRAMTFRGAWPTLSEIAAFRPWRQANSVKGPED